LAVAVAAHMEAHLTVLLVGLVAAAATMPLAALEAPVQADKDTQAELVILAIMPRAAAAALLL